MTMISQISFLSSSVAKPVGFAMAFESTDVEKKIEAAQYKANVEIDRKVLQAQLDHLTQKGASVSSEDIQGLLKRIFDDLATYNNYNRKVTRDWFEQENWGPLKPYKDILIKTINLVKQIPTDFSRWYGAELIRDSMSKRSIEIPEDVTETLISVFEETSNGERHTQLDFERHKKKSLLQTARQFVNGQLARFNKSF